MGSNTGTVWQEAQKNQIASVFQRKAGLKVPMDLFTLIPRTIIGVTYPAFASLKAVLSDSPESCGAWLRYWVVLGVFSLVQQHHKEIEDQAEMAKKTVMEKLGLCFKKEKGDKDKGEKVTKSLFKKMESTDKKES